MAKNKEKKSKSVDLLKGNFACVWSDGEFVDIGFGGKFLITMDKMEYCEFCEDMENLLNSKKNKKLFNKFQKDIDKWIDEQKKKEACVDVVDKETAEAFHKKVYEQFSNDIRDYALSQNKGNPNIPQQVMQSSQQQSDRRWQIGFKIPPSELPYDSFEHPNFKKLWHPSNIIPVEMKKPEPPPTRIFINEEEIKNNKKN